MDLGEIPLLSLLKERMAWLDRRQDVLSQNVANADTPGYTARDVKPIDFAQTLRSTTSNGLFNGALTTTDPHHIALRARSTGFSDVASPDVEANPSGNTVSLEQEMIKVADTQAQFQAATNLYAKALDMMKIAIGRTGN